MKQSYTTLPVTTSGFYDCYRPDMQLCGIWGISTVSLQQAQGRQIWSTIGVFLSKPLTAHETSRKIIDDW